MPLVSPRDDDRAIAAFLGIRRLVGVVPTNIGWLDVQADGMPYAGLSSLPATRRGHPARLTTQTSAIDLQLHRASRGLPLLPFRKARLCVAAAFRLGLLVASSASRSVLLRLSPTPEHGAARPGACHRWCLGTHHHGGPFPHHDAHGLAGTGRPRRSLLYRRAGDRTSGMWQLTNGAHSPTTA